METDSITIVGGGPAGCVAGTALARDGFKVTLYERNLDKSKACGGGVSWRMLKEFKGFIEGLKVFPIEEACFDIEGEKVEIKFKKCVGAILHRPEFDKHLRKITEDAGVKIINKSISKLSKTEMVIDARGFKGSSVKVAMRGFCKTKKQEKVFFMFRKDFVKFGFFWLFPMQGGVANVGVGGYVKSLRESFLTMLKKFCKDRGLKVFGISSAPIHMGGDIDAAVSGNIIRVGERAGLVSPLTGEGMYHAMVSGKIAADCISKNKINEYEKLIKKEFESEFRISKMLRRLFVAAPTKIKIRMLKSGLRGFEKSGYGVVV